MLDQRFIPSRGSAGMKLRRAEACRDGCEERERTSSLCGQQRNKPAKQPTVNDDKENGVTVDWQARSSRMISKAGSFVRIYALNPPFT